MAFLPTNASQVQQFAVALYGIKVGSTTMAQVNNDILAVGGLNKALNAYYTASFGSSTTAAVAATVAANLGLTGTAATDAAAYITAVLNGTAASARGEAIQGVLSLFSTLTANATFGAAATAWNAKVENAIAYTGTTDAVLIAGAAVEGTIFTLGTGSDTVPGTASADTINATHLTLGASDAITGGAGVDTLNIVNTGTTGFAPAGVISGVENIAIKNLNTGTTVAAVTAVAQVNTYAVPVPTAATSVVSVLNYGGISTNVTTGTTSSTFGAALAAAINQSAGRTIAVFTAGADPTANAGSLVVTAPTAGTALPAITLSAALTANVPAVTFTTANTAGVTAVTPADTVAAGLFVGATSFTNDMSTSQVDFTGLAAGQSLTIKGNTGVALGTTTAAWGATVTSTVVNIQGGTTGTGAVTLTDAGATTVTINSNGVPATSTGAIGTNTIGALTTGGTATGTVNIVADSNLSTGTAGSTINTKTVNVSGGALTVVLGALTAPNLTTIDASGLTAGGLTASLVAGVTSFKGGAGADTITTANVVTNASIDAGAGTDVLRIGAYADVDTLAEAKTFIGFETVDTLTLTGTTLDMSLFTTSTITGLRSGVAAAPAFSNVTAAQAANITITGNQGTTSTYGVINASQAGQIDTMNVAINDGSSTVNTITLAALTAPGVEVVNFNNTDHLTLTVLTGLTTSTITGAGNVSITTGALAANVNSNINAAASTGTLTWDSQAATGNGFSVTGSATKANTFTGARALADVFVGGVAADTFTNAVDAAAVTTAGDIFTGGAGADTFIIRGDVASGVASTIYATAPRITDFTVGVGGDILQLSSKVQNNTGATGNAALTANTAVAAGATVIQSVAVNAANAAVTTGAALIKLTSGVAESATFQTMFNAAIGTATVTVTTGTEAFFTLYDTTNSRMVIGQVESAGGTGTLIESADVVRLIGTANMSAADYALFASANLAIGAA